MSIHSKRSSISSSHHPPPSQPIYEEPEKMKISEPRLEDEIQSFKVDLEHRDPAHINRDLKVNFVEIFAEPDPTLHSIDCVWLNSYKVFELTKLFVYRFLSIICGLPIAVCMGCTFACFSFNIIWVFQPFVRLFRIQCMFFKQLWAYSVHIFLRPLTLAMGGCLSTIRIHSSNGAVIEESFIA